MIAVVNIELYRYEIHSLLKAFYPQETVKVFVGEPDAGRYPDPAFLRVQFEENRIEMQITGEGGPVPDEKGMDTLNISGSAEFSEDQFHELAAKLRGLAPGKDIYIVDCRIESHALLNGISVSWYGDHNWANKGKSLEEAEKDEQERFGSLIGKKITAYSVSENAPDESEEILVDRWMTEKELVESEGFHYLRLPCQDHSWPYEEAIDTFIDLVQGIDTENTWMHFHCQAGKSRTGIFMAIYDMMKNPDVKFEDIMLRHAMTGSSYFPYVDESSDIADVYAFRAKRIRQVYDYIQEMDGEYTIPWSEWISQKES